MWSETFKRWLDLVFWWLPRSESEAGREGETAGRPGAGPESRGTGAARGESQARAGGAGRQAAGPASSPAPAGGQARAPQGEAPGAPEGRQPAGSGGAGEGKPDDLTVIKGIGPTMQGRLRSLGIRTFADLAGADPERLTQRLKAEQVVISKAQVQKWIAAARERA